MEATSTGCKLIHRDGQDYSAEVTIRFRPYQGAIGVGFSSDAQRYFNSTFGVERTEHIDDVWQSVVKVIQAAGWRLAKWPRHIANTFRAEVVRVHVSQGASRED